MRRRKQIVTDSVGLEAGDVTIKVADGTLPRLSRHACQRAARLPVILVAPEVFGLNPYMKDVCRRLAKAGYFAVTPDVYARKADLTEDHQHCRHHADRQQPRPTPR